MLSVKKLELEAILFILVGIVAGYLLLIHSEHANVRTLAASNTPQFPGIAALPTSIPPTAVPTPLPTIIPTATPAPIAPFIPTVANTKQISPDGTKSLTLRTIQNKNGTVTYDVTSSDSKTFMFSRTLPKNESISLPFNAWSPNDRYYFLQENTGTGTNIMVFNDNGDPFASAKPYLDLSADFAKREPNAIFDQASGWAADNLIVILTKNTNGSEGTSYWYSVPNEGIIPLATKF